MSFFSEQEDPELRALRSYIKKIAWAIGSPKDEDRLDEVIPLVLASYRARVEAAEAKLDDALAKLSNVNRLLLDREAKLAELEEMGRAWQESDEHKHANALREEVEWLREAITGLRAAHHSGDRDEWEAAVRAALQGGGE
jgi:chromosome segregation ATPase